MRLPILTDSLNLVFIFGFFSVKWMRVVETPWTVGHQSVQGKPFSRSWYSFYRRYKYGQLNWCGEMVTQIFIRLAESGFEAGKHRAFTTAPCSHAAGLEMKCNETFLLRWFNHKWAQKKLSHERFRIFHVPHMGILIIIVVLLINRKELVNSRVVNVSADKTVKTK